MSLAKLDRDSFLKLLEGLDQVRSSGGGAKD